MNKFRSKTRHLLVSLVFVSSSVLFSQQAVAGSVGHENDGAANGAFMVVDLVIARPMGIVATVLGTAVFVASLPFTLLGGNVETAGNALVIEPAKFTFVRPLGE